MTKAGEIVAFRRHSLDFCPIPAVFWRNVKERFFELSMSKRFPEIFMDKFEEKEMVPQGQIKDVCTGIFEI